MAKSEKQRAKERRKRMRAAGYQQVNLWAPSDQVRRLKQYAARLRAEHERKQEG